MMFLKYDRIQTTDHHIGTVKYVGPLHVWPESVAYGIEWDDVERGKNSGSVDGVEYFKSEIEGAATFMKASSKKLRTERLDFADVLIRQYAGEENETVLSSAVQFGSKVAESYGFHKLNQIQLDFDNLQSVSLDRKEIAIADKDIGPMLPNVTYLDLSYNLFSDLNDIWNIVEQLPSLKSLNLNGNRFLSRSVSGSVHPGLESLQMSSTKIDMGTVCEILQKFPNLKEISLSGNNYERIHSISCHTVDLSFNRLKEVPKTGAKVLYLEGNQIETLDTAISPISHLDLRNNIIGRWSEIDKINEAYPRLVDLRINDNPVFFGLSVEEMTINLIARLDGSKIRKINGASVLDDEITSAELYFISKVRKGDYTVSSRRWNELLQKYNMSEELESGQKENQLRKKKLDLVLNLGDASFQRTFLVDNSVLRLRGVVAKKFNTSVLNVELSYTINEDEVAELRVTRVIDDDLAVLDSFGFHQKQNIYIKLY